MGVRFEKIIHDLKIEEFHFCCVRNGSKTFEVRKNDRGFKPMDVLHLKEWNSGEKKYTGRSLLVEVDHILLGGEYGIDKDYCVMSIKKLQSK